MSVFVNSTSTVLMPDRETPLARCEGQMLSIWPGGLGFGPCIQMTTAEWRQLRAGVDSAIAVAATQ